MLERKFRKANEISLIPLINVIFLLLIFFLVAGRVNEPDALPIEIPSAKSGQLENTQAPESITIMLGKKGKMLLNKNEVSEEVLNSVLKYELERKPDLPVIIKADATLPASNLMKIMVKVSDLGGKNFFVATEFPQ